LLEPKATANTFFLISPSSVPLSYCKNPQKRNYHQNVKEGDVYIQFLFNFVYRVPSGWLVWFYLLQPNQTGFDNSITTLLFQNWLIEIFQNTFFFSLWSLAICVPHFATFTCRRKVFCTHLCCLIFGCVFYLRRLSSSIFVMHLCLGSSDQRSLFLMISLCLQHLIFVSVDLHTLFLVFDACSLSLISLICTLSNSLKVYLQSCRFVRFVLKFRYLHRISEVNKLVYKSPTIE